MLGYTFPGEKKKQKDKTSRLRSFPFRLNLHDPPRCIAVKSQRKIQMDGNFLRSPQGWKILKGPNGSKDPLLRNALRVEFGGSSIFLGGTWIHRGRTLMDGFVELLAADGCLWPKWDQIPKKPRDSSKGNLGFLGIYHTSFYAGDWICLKPFGPSLNPIYALNTWKIYLHLQQM